MLKGKMEKKKEEYEIEKIEGLKYEKRWERKFGESLIKEMKKNIYGKKENLDKKR